MKKNRTLTILISLLLLSNLLQAQESQELFDMSLSELMNIEIDVSSTEAVTIFNTPSNVTLIDRETILRYDYQNVAEAVRSVAGIEIYQTNIDRNVSTSRGILQNYYTNKLLIMINNIPTWQPIYGNGIIDRIDINDVERIEILKGPASVLYGTNAYTGVINIVLIKSDIDEVNARLQVGTPEIGAAGVNVSHVKNDFNLFISANTSFEKRTPYEVSSARSQPYNGDSVYFYQEEYIGHNFNIQTNYKSHQLFLNNFNFDHAFLGITPSFASGGGTLVENDGTLINYRFDSEVSEKLRLLSSLSYDYNHRSFAVKSDQSMLIDLSAKRLSANLKAAYTLSEKLNFEIGFEGFAGESDHNILDKLKDTLIKANMDQAEDLSEWSGVFQANYKLGLFNILAGTRFTQNKQFGENLSSRVSAVVAINEKNSLKLLFGQSFRAPTMLELYMNHPTVAGFKDLQPETSTSYELAYLTQIGNFFMQIVGYYAEYDQLIQRYVPTATTTATYRNAESFSGFGTEIELKYQNPKILNAFLNYNYMNGEGAVADDNFKYVPEHTISFGLSKPINSFAITLNGYAYSEVEGQYASIDPQAMLDANISYRHESEKLKFTHRVSAKNISNSNMLIPEYIRSTENINTMSTTEFGTRFIYTLLLNF